MRELDEGVKDLKGLRIKEYLRQLREKSYFLLENMSKEQGLVVSGGEKEKLVVQLGGLYWQQLEHSTLTISKDLLSQKLELDVNNPEDLQII